MIFLPDPQVGGSGTPHPQKMVEICYKLGISMPTVIKRFILTKKKDFD